MFIGIGTSIKRGGVNCMILITFLYTDYGEFVTFFSIRVLVKPKKKYELSPIDWCMYVNNILNLFPQRNIIFKKKPFSSLDINYG